MAEVKYLDKTGLGTVWSKVKGIVTPKADKVSGATAGHLAGLNSSGNLTDSGLAATNIAQKDGSYSGMTVGAAEDLVSAESVASEFTSRITGGSTAVGKGGTALVDKIKGRTLVWNQLVQNGNFANGTTGWSQFNSTIAASSGELTVTKNAIGAGTGGFAMTTITGDPAHRYYVGCDAIALSDTEIYLGFHSINHTVSGNESASTKSATYKRIHLITSPVASDHVLCVRVGVGASADGVAGKVKNVMLVDLTLMFGGNEPSTPEEFEALYPDPYYDYNPGTPKSNAATAIETVGWNQFDKDITVESLSVDGSGGSGTFRYVKRFKALAGSYLFNYVNNSNVFVKTVINGTYGAAMGVNTSGGTTFTMSAPGEIWVYSSQEADINSVSDQLCISLSDASRNGTYEPYWRSELELNIPTLTGKLNGTGNSVVIFPNGLRSAGTVFDEIVGNKAIKRIGAVDLGSMTWGSDAHREHTRFFSALADSKTGSSAYQLANQINSYGYISTSKVVADNTVNLGLSKYNNNIYIRNDAYEGQNGSVFAAAMSGVMLYYELATPEEYILDEALPTAMRNDPYGTERRLPEDTAATVLAPFRADITYSTNIKEAVQSMHQNYINVNSMQDFLAALGAQMGGTWTMRPADGKFDFTFTPNPSNE